MLWPQGPFPLCILGCLGEMPSLPRGLPALQEGFWVASVICILPNISQAVPPWLFLALPAEWWVCPPLGSAGACSVSSLSRQFVLPPSTLLQRHAKTFHTISPSNGGYPKPICSESLGIALHPSPFLFPLPASTHQQIAILPPGTSPACCGILLPSVCDSYRGAKKQMNNHSKNQGQA